VAEVWCVPRANHRKVLPRSGQWLPNDRDHESRSIILANFSTFFHHFAFRHRPAATALLCACTNILLRNHILGWHPRRRDAAVRASCSTTSLPRFSLTARSAESMRRTHTGRLRKEPYPSAAAISTHQMSSHPAPKVSNMCRRKR
jgi:hypothetical protein